MQRRLTGKIRYREQKRLFRSGVLVLQVEETIKNTRVVFSGSRLDEEEYEYTEWRDAKITDLRPGTFNS